MTRHWIGAAMIGLLAGWTAEALPPAGSDTGLMQVAAIDPHAGDPALASDAGRTGWQNGEWVRTWRDGHLAWWWAVGGSWYWYAAPSYPYPSAVAPVSMRGLTPPAVAEEQSAGPSWIYCDKPAREAEAPASCNGNWHRVAVAAP
jgi:hypothetical protein